MVTTLELPRPSFLPFLKVGVTAHYDLSNMIKAGLTVTLASSLSMYPVWSYELECV